MARQARTRKTRAIAARLVPVVALGGFAAEEVTAQSWVNFANETSTRLVMSPSLQGDNLEKDFAIGDFDRDFDLDLVCMRKFPGSITGGFRDLLLMNEGGILIDRTVEYGSAADAPGSQGMLDPVNDRDVKAVDVDLDGWLDLVVMTTMSDHLGPMLGQPRVYRNLGEDAEGAWQGFRFEDARIPLLVAKSGAEANPRACDAVVKDLTGDGYPDIFLVDYDTPETSGTICIDLNGDGDTGDAGECQQSPPETPSKDFDNRLLVNVGADSRGPGPGHFIDTANTRMTATQLASSFGAAADAADFNLDGAIDIVRINTLTTGQNVGILYGTPGPDLGSQFTGPVAIANDGPYNHATADVNNDGRMDLVVVDDGQDRVLINTHNNPIGNAVFTKITITDSAWEFGNSVAVADLDRDGFTDVITCDVDADLGPFCPTTGRRARIYRNLGNVPNVTFDEIGQVIPNANLASTFDVAPIDIDGDAYPDLVIGRCAGIEVWMNRPQLDLSFVYPDGRPETVPPGTPISFPVLLAASGGGIVSEPQLNWSIDGGKVQSAPLVPLGGSAYRVEMPALACGSSTRYYLSATLSGEVVRTDPPDAPARGFLAVPSGAEEVVILDDHFEIESGWTVVNLGTVTAGTWERGDPNPTSSSGVPVSPDHDYTPAPGAHCFTTLNAPITAFPHNGDLDGGPTALVSPSVDLRNTDATCSYAVWHFCNDLANPAEADSLLVEVSDDDGQTWVTADTVPTSSYVWKLRTFRINEFITPSESTRIRFVVNDTPNNSMTDSAIDAVRISARPCSQAAGCTGDLNADGLVNQLDLGAVLAAWGQPGGTTDLNGDGITSGPDVAAVLSSWGMCP
jgi:hypothetical protein